jgi:hypothetical protein
MAGIGAGMGLLNNLFGSHKPQVTTTSIDQGSQNEIMYRRNLARGMVGQGMPQLDPALLAAMQGYGGYADAGRMGLAAFTDPSQMAKFQAYGNEQMNPIFDRQRAQLENSYRSRQAGSQAFGVRGQMMGPNYADINNAQTQFGMQNMDNAQKMAMMMANYGQFGIAGQQNLGQYFTERPMNWNQQAIGLLSNAYGGPLSTSTSSPNPSGNMFQSMLGGAMTGLSFAKPGAAPGAPTPSAPVYSGGYMPPPDQSWRPGNQPNPWSNY